MSHPDERRIFALLDGRLDERSHRDFEAHLQKCEACATRRDRLIRLGSMVRQTVVQSEPTFDFDATESRLLDRIAREPRASEPRVASLWRMLIPAAIAALVVLAVFGSLRHTDTPRSVVVARRPPVPVEAGVVGERSRAIVTLIGGTALAAAGRDQPKQAVSIGSEIHEGTFVETGANSRVVVQTAIESGFRLAPGSRVELLTLREGGSIIRLHSGRMENRVQKLAQSGVYRVISGDLTIEVRGTRFAVTRADASTRVEVSEGTVAVRRHTAIASSVEPIALLRAPASASFPDERGVSDAQIRHDSLDPRALALYVLPFWDGASVLRIPALEGIRRLEVDWMDVGTDVLLRRQRGPAHLVLYPLEGDPLVMDIAVDLPSVTFAMPEARPNRPVAARVGQIDREALQRAMASYRHQVQRCYDRRLKRVPNLRLGLELRITIGTDGAVASASLRGDGQDPEVSECILRVADRWTFQAPRGGPVTVNVPFTFAPRGLSDSIEAPQ